MKANMGSTDRILRIVIGVILAVLYFTGVIEGTLGIILLIVGGVFILTSLVRFCPAYVPLGMNTCKKKN